MKYYNLETCELYNHAKKIHKFNDTGALVAYSGKYTGRCPDDKRIVENKSSSDIWWGDVNKPIDEILFYYYYIQAHNYFEEDRNVYIVDSYAGWDKDNQITVRTICSDPYHALFMKNMLIPANKIHQGKVDLEIVTNCSKKMTQEMADILNDFRYIRLTGSFDGPKKINEYQRVGSKWENGLDNWLEYGEMLNNKRMVIHQTFTVLNVNHLDESLKLYEPHCDSISWSYDEYYLNFLCAPDWFEEWILKTNSNEKLKEIFKQKRVYDDEKWRRVMRTIYALDEFYGTNIEEANPELGKILRIHNKKRVYNHTCDGDPNCFYCNMYKEVI